MADGAVLYIFGVLDPVKTHQGSGAFVSVLVFFGLSGKDPVFPSKEKGLHRLVSVFHPDLAAHHVTVVLEGIFPGDLQARGVRQTEGKVALRVRLRKIQVPDGGVIHAPPHEETEVFIVFQDDARRGDFSPGDSNQFYGVSLLVGVFIQVKGLDPRPGRGEDQASVFKGDRDVFRGLAHRRGGPHGKRGGRGLA